MKILVFSDSHGSLGNMYEAVERESPDRIVHLGDHFRDAEDLDLAFGGLDILYVPGNCDYAAQIPANLEIEVDGVRIFLTHGHLFGVKSGTQRLLLEAQRRGVPLALFGHTHQAFCEEIDGVTLFNPGCCGRFTSRPSYGVIETDHGQFTCRVCDCD